MNTSNNKYQLNCFLSPVLDQSQLDGLVAQIKGWITKEEGQIISERKSQKRLAYSIKHFNEASFLDLNFSLTADKLKELENKLKIEKDVLRYLIFRTKNKKIRKEKVKVKTADKSPEIDKQVEEVLSGHIQEEKEIEKIITAEKAPEIKADTKKELPKETKEEKNKVKLEDLDKKLDEILNE